MTVGTALGRLLFSRDLQPFSLLVFASKFLAFASINNRSSGVGIGLSAFDFVGPEFLTLGALGAGTRGLSRLNCLEIN